MSKGLLDCNEVMEIGRASIRRLRETVYSTVEYEVSCNVRLHVRLQITEQVRTPLNHWIRGQCRKYV